jgi:hypothetical protein
VRTPVGAGMFQRVMQQLYTNEWLSEEAIFAWNEDISDQVQCCETISAAAVLSVLSLRLSGLLRECVCLRGLERENRRLIHRCVRVLSLSLSLSLSARDRSTVSAFSA